MVAAGAWVQCGSLGWRGALVLLGGGARHGAPPPPPLAPPSRGNGHGGGLCGRHTHLTSSLLMAQKAFLTPYFNIGADYGLTPQALFS